MILSLVLALLVVGFLAFLLVQGVRGASALSYVTGVLDGFNGRCSYPPRNPRYGMYLDTVELLDGSADQGTTRATKEVI
jgi:hypothetical protein